MALIKCKECGKQVSDKAAACPNCGCPIGHKEHGSAGQSGVQTIQETSKRYKAQMLISALMAICGAPIATGAYMAYTNNALFYLGGTVCLAGVLWYVIVRLLMWWHHG